MIGFTRILQPAEVGTCTGERQFFFEPLDFRVPPSFRLTQMGIGTKWNMINENGLEVHNGSTRSDYPLVN